MPCDRAEGGAHMEVQRKTQQDLDHKCICRPGKKLRLFLFF
jgi:hypothetical protein